MQLESEKLPTQPDNRVKKFKLPHKPLHREEFVHRVQESAIVKHVATIQRLFDALADGICRCGDLFVVTVALILSALTSFTLVLFNVENQGTQKPKGPTLFLSARLSRDRIPTFCSNLILRQLCMKLHEP